MTMSFLPPPTLAALALGALLASLSFQATAQAKDLPPVIQSLQRQGLRDLQEFPAGNGLRGFAGLAGQEPLAVYVTPDGNGIVGTRLSPDGQRIDEKRIDDLVAKPMSDATFAKLDASTWVLDGKADAPRIVYTFSDPNCPYCHKFWEAARPWVNAGKVQLRHVVVGIIKADSSTKAAAILGARDKTAALLQNERQFANDGIKPADSVSAEIRSKLDANQMLMGELGFRGTPGIVFRDEKGMAQHLGGMPQGDTMKMVMGSAAKP